MVSDEPKAAAGRETVVFFHAHPDDESIFPGGTIASYARSGKSGTHGIRRQAIGGNGLGRLSGSLTWPGPARGDVMSDDSWESYSAADTPAGEVIVPTDVVPIVDAANTDAWQADIAASWAEWNAEGASDATAYAATEVAYAQQLYAAGFDGAGDAALARAEFSADVAESYGGTADVYYATAESEYQSAADGYGAAADYTADVAAYDTTASDDTGVADTTASYDTAVADTTSSYDATE